MTVRDGTVAGMPARIARVSFTGELAYEINVEGWLGRPMWEAVMAAGEPFGVTPYGTEAMHLLRAEKGFVIVGQDTDGTVTPGDLGMSWIVRKDDSDFVGTPIAVAARHGRDPTASSWSALLPTIPTPGCPKARRWWRPRRWAWRRRYRCWAMSRRATAARRWAGRSRWPWWPEGATSSGPRLVAPLPGGDIEAEVTAPVFYDERNERRDGGGA